MRKISKERITIKPETESLTSLNKWERTNHWFRQHPQMILQCILCQTPLTLADKQLSCQNGHRFDAAKQGYFFLATKSMESKYDQILFEARRQIIRESPLYEKLHLKLTSLINRLTEQHKSTLSVLDAGSGEGSHLYSLEQKSSQHSYVGIDLSKAGVQLATDYNGHLLSMVADLTHLPFASRQFDLILSILSPANYDEFDRLLKDDGVILKIVPNAGYLSEVRQFMIEKAYIKDEPYHNEKVVQSFKLRYQQAVSERISETVLLSPKQMAQLLRMTPLTWQLTDKERDNLLAEMVEKNQLTMTLDVTLLISNVI